MARASSPRSLKTAGQPPLALMYTRISEDHEGQELGVSRQKEDLQHQIQSDGVELAGAYQDNDRGASTRSLKHRPEYVMLLERARQLRTEHPDREVRIYAYTSSRLTRKPRENEDLIDLAERYGVEYHYLRSPRFNLNTADGRNIARILSANDAAESERIAERVSRTFDQRARDGFHFGGGPVFGYRRYKDEDNNTRLVVDETEAALIRFGVDQVLAGASVMSVQRAWNETEVKPPRAKYWSFQSVRNILASGRIAGLLEHEGEVVRHGEWDPIISEQEHAALRARLGQPQVRMPADRRRGAGTGSVRSTWLGSGVYLCGLCSATMQSKRAHGVMRYVCSRQHHLVIRQSDTDGIVIAAINALLVEHGPNLLAETRAEEAAELTRQANTIRGRLDELVTVYEADEMSTRAYAAASQKLEAQLEEVERSRANLITPSSTLTGIADADNPGLAFRRLQDTQHRRAVVNTLMTVTILPASRTTGQDHVNGGWTPVQERIRIEPKTAPPAQSKRQSR